MHRHKYYLNVRQLLHRTVFWLVGSFVLGSYQLTVCRKMNVANLGGKLGSLGGFTAITTM
jgi:hypothetical protein